MSNLKKISQEDLWCEYSDLPSPLAYANCVDYYSMGNHGRFPVSKKKKSKSFIKKYLKKVLIRVKKW